MKDLLELGLFLLLDISIVLVDINLLCEFLTMSGQLLLESILEVASSLLLLFDLLFHEFPLFLNFLEKILVFLLQLFILFKNEKNTLLVTLSGMVTLHLLLDTRVVVLKVRDNTLALLNFVCLHLLMLFFERLGL
jgi:hypothetical protein